VKCLQKYSLNLNVTTYPIFKEIKENMNKIKNEIYILSISGGVDSIICSYILKMHSINFVCVHINYNNREESEKEEEFVKFWCKILGIKLYVRKIHEISRLKCMKYGLRELYETYTKDVRFHTYTKIMENPHVILGHNKDDCFENILTNISHKTKYNNLLGMELSNIIIHQDQHINFIRPMLDVDKASIYKFAHELNIPYLNDSTPKWSQRGQIRDVIRPALEKWNYNLIDGIFETSIILKETNDIIDILVQEWINKLREYKNEFTISDISVSKIFWNKLLEKMNIKCSSRSLNGLLLLLNKIKNEQIKIHINTNVKYEINKDYQLKITQLREQKVSIMLTKRG